MKRSRWALAIGVGALLASAAPAVAAPPCDPFGPPAFRGEVPTPKQVLGIDLGERDVTTAESDAYVAAVDAASPRVTAGTAARSVQGRDLRYAIVGNPDRVTPNGLARIRASAAQLMDPSTRPRDARAIAKRDPAILWIAGNVHGGEESGTDASLRVLWELADRSDCAASRILDEALVVILPTQNPDGREADTRRNAYGFDMNRDWFARTQPETDGKVELLRRYPPVLFIDAHEMGGTNDYFFPPNADPIYHETPDSAVNWINDLYGAANQELFTTRGIPFFNYDVYDLFYQGYGDTVPATGFGAAGMTFEKSSGDAAAVRVEQQYLTQWNSLSAAAGAKRDVLEEWHADWVEAERQGRQGALEPNAVFEEGNDVLEEVPDIRVRHYFIRTDDPSKAREVQALVRRLQRMDVRVRRITRPVTVDDYTPYGRGPRWEVVPAGTYVVPMEQAKKHWVQAMLNEDTYVPFPYFYDVTGWSSALLFNVDGGYSGRKLGEMRTAPVAAQADPGVPPVPADQPSIALWSMSPDYTRGIESSGWLRYLLDRWGLAYTDVTAEDIKAGGLAAYDVLLVPDGYASPDPDDPAEPHGLGDLAPEGRAALATWVEDGGRYVGWLDGAVLAAGAGISSASFELADDLGISSPGALIRTTVARRSPLADGVGRSAYAFWDARYVMQANGAAAPVRFPAASTRDFFVSGFADGAEALAGSAGVVDEPVGDGRTVAFGFEPNFRAFTDGTAKLLRNAILGDEPAAFEDAAAEPPVAARAAASARQLSVARDPVRLVVTSAGESAAAAVLEAQGLPHRIVRTPGRVSFTIPNPGGLTGDELPWSRTLAGELQQAAVPVVMYKVP